MDKSYLKNMSIKQLMAHIKKSLGNSWHVKSTMLNALGNANHYAHVLGFEPRDVLAAWEISRRIYAPNFYRKSRIKKSVYIFETIEELNNMFPSGEYRCGCCGGVSTDPTSCNSGRPAKTKSGVCDWKTYGLFGPRKPYISYIIKNGSPYDMVAKTIFAPIELER